jgi:S1-C subfamily serine protease
LPEDVLFKYNGQEICDTRQFIQLVQHTAIGSLAELDIVRQGSPMRLGALIESRRPRPARGRLAFSLSGSFNPQAVGLVSGTKRIIPQPMVGLDTLVLTPELASALQIPKQSGLLVVDVAKRMPADLAGVLVGDLIVAMDGQPITDAPSFASHLQTRDWGAQMELRVLRRGVELPITIRMPDQGK